MPKWPSRAYVREAIRGLPADKKYDVQVAVLRARRKRDLKSRYQQFARDRRAEVGHCEMRSRVCTGGPDTVHHVIKLSAGGARIPGELADRQGQVFVVACMACNLGIESYPDLVIWARENGFTRRNPLRRMDAESKGF